MRRLFGNHNPNKSSKKKKRRSPSHGTGTAQGLPQVPEGQVASNVATTHTAGTTNSNTAATGTGTGTGTTTTTTNATVTVTVDPGYQYALNEFSQTVAPGAETNNDDGRLLLRQTTTDGGDDDDDDDGDNEKTARTTPRYDMEFQHPHHAWRSPTGSAASLPNSLSGISSAAASTASSPRPQYVFSQDHMGAASASASAGASAGASASASASAVDDDSTAGPSAYSPTKLRKPPSHGIPGVGGRMGPHTYRMRQGFSPSTAHLADATYEEWYGDAYLGGPAKYMYPSGYQSMRPRGGPWKLSIVICLLFTWLSVFIIGHCSDRVDQSVYEQIDDDAVANNTLIETRWCGSRLLYMMWVVSMLITGLATAYCSVIGYIKVRDFAVANTRSHHPGVAEGKSDYYVRLGDSAASATAYNPSAYIRGSGSGGSGSGGGNQYQYHNNLTGEKDDEQYQRTIYQADGTPQFWGSQIYRPTQAAVAVTSR